MESQKPTRDQRSWVIGMAEAGFNINYVVFIKLLLTEYSVVLCKQSWLDIAQDRADQKN